MPPQLRQKPGGVPLRAAADKGALLVASAARVPADAPPDGALVLPDAAWLVLPDASHLALPA